MPAMCLPEEANRLHDHLHAVQCVEEAQYLHDHLRDMQHLHAMHSVAWLDA